MSIRRHLSSETGPVPITPAMDPQMQTIVRAGNQGVHEAMSSGKRKRRPFSFRETSTRVKKQQRSTQGSKINFPWNE